MAIYHASFKIVKRSDGKSVVAAAAYRSGKKFYDERENKVHNYQRKERVLSHKIMLCKNAPEKWEDAERLWNNVEAAEKSSRAQLARNCDFALPRELNETERAELIYDYVQRNFVDHGMCAQVDIHDTKNNNPHAHVLLTMRAIDENGNFLPKQRSEFILDDKGERIPIVDPKTGKQKINTKRKGMKMWKRRTVKTTDWDEKESLIEWCHDWAVSVNRALEKANVRDQNGNYVTVSEKSLKEQGINREPTIHEGPKIRDMEKRGISTDLRSYNDAVRALNDERETERANAEKMAELENKEAELAKAEAETKRRQQQLEAALRRVRESLRQAQQLWQEEEEKAALWQDYVKRKEDETAAEQPVPVAERKDWQQVFSFRNNESHLKKLREAAEHPKIAPTKKVPRNVGYWGRIADQYRKENGLDPISHDNPQQALGDVVPPSGTNDTKDRPQAVTRPLGRADGQTRHEPDSVTRDGHVLSDKSSPAPTRANADAATMNGERSVQTLPSQEEPHRCGQVDDRATLAATASQRDDHSSQTPSRDTERDNAAGITPGQRPSHEDTNDKPKVQTKDKSRHYVNARHRSDDHNHGMSR